ncbi:FAD-dependent monooxygenase [Carnimonas nigrificans]|uniref:FAD-dependent monooxygenase n=1 Tax=Carnimonas nigrificans TaxID=64323 RepID=UPI00047161E1|nr:FAD-dependent monooxygenase [Carnimonas nigrificans]
MNKDRIDLTVVGLGSVGLATALAAAQAGLEVAVIDPQSAQQLSGGDFDGRDVAISNASLRWLDTLGVTCQLDAGQRSPIRGAHVIDDVVDKKVSFGPAAGEQDIGAFVPEYRLRQLAFTELEKQSNCRFLLETRVAALDYCRDAVALTLEDGQEVCTRLVAAVDGRRSPLRGMLGIGASMQDFGTHMLCCRVEHELAGDGWTSQRFVDDGCMAILPLSDHVSSLALMVSANEAAQVTRLDDAHFEQWLNQRIGNNLGRLSLASQRFSVPLGSHYADRFVAERAVLLGDAAVGMLPITAHGLNLGLIGARSFIAELLAARSRGEAFDEPHVLKRHARRAHATAKPLYLATNEICRLFKRTDPISLQARRTLMQMSGPFEQLVGMNCEQDNPRKVPWLGVLKSLPRALVSRGLAG